MRVTIKDIAQACGVGVATVSRAVNGSGYVRKEIREDILKYIENVGWKASNAALQLKTGKSRMVTILVNDILHYYNAKVVDGISRELYRLGYQVSLNVGQCYQALEECRKRQHTDAVIVVGFTNELRQGLDDLRAQGVKVVTIGGNWNYDGPMIYPDHVTCGYEAVKHCIKAGHRKIAFFGAFGSRTNLHSLEECHYRMLYDLLIGIGRATEEHDIRFNLPEDTVGDFYGDLRSLQKKLLERSHTAYICETIELTVHFYVTCRQLGLKIPQDVSFIGIGAIDSFRAFDPLPNLFVHDYEMVIRKALDILFIPDQEIIDQEIVVPYIYSPGNSLDTPKNISSITT